MMTYNVEQYQRLLRVWRGSTVFFNRIEYPHHKRLSYTYHAYTHHTHPSIVDDDIVQIDVLVRLLRREPASIPEHRQPVYEIPRLQHLGTAHENVPA